jgi:hypothetical protein
VNNSDVSLGNQFCENITFILYIINNVRYNNNVYKTGLEKIVAISAFGIIKRGDKTRRHCIWEKNPLKIANLFIKGTCL